MAIQTLVPDTFSLTGDHLERLRAVLRISHHKARVAQSGVARHLEDALRDLEEDIHGRLAALKAAEEDDLADAEASGEAERVRRAWLPLRAA